MFLPQVKLQWQSKFHHMLFSVSDVSGLVRCCNWWQTGASNPNRCLKPWLLVMSPNAPRSALTIVQDVSHLHARLANSTAAGPHGNAPPAQPHHSWLVEASPRKLEQDFSHASLQPPSANGNDWHPVKGPSRPTTHRHGQSSTNGNVPFAANGKNGWAAANGNGNGNGQFSAKENGQFSAELDGHPRQVSPRLDSHPRQMSAQMDGHPGQLSPQPQLYSKQKGGQDPFHAKH